MRRLLLLLLAVAVALALAGVYVPSDAASAGGRTVTRQALDSDLSAIAGSQSFICYLEERTSLETGPGAPLLGAGRGSSTTGVYGMAFTDGWLSHMLQAQLEETMVTSRRIAITTAELTLGRQELVRQITEVLHTYASQSGSSVAGCGGSGTAVLASVPTSFAAEQVRAETVQSVLEADSVGAGLSSSGIAAYFDAHRAQFDKVCLSVIVLKTKTKAEAVRAAIEGGASFAQEAASTSATASTGANSGAVGCGVLAGTALTASLSGLAVGQVSAPISYGGSYLLAELTSRTPLKLSTVRTTVITVMLLAGRPNLDAALRKAVRTAHVTVDPRYGKLGTGKSATTIEPPASPSGAWLVSPSADVPGAAAASAFPAAPASPAAG